MFLVIVQSNLWSGQSNELVDMTACGWPSWTSHFWVWSTRQTHTHTTVLLLFWNLSGTTRVSRYQKGKTSRGKTNLDLLEQEIVSGSGICWARPYASLHLIPDNLANIPPLSFLQAGCLSCRPTNSVKALKEFKSKFYQYMLCALKIIRIIAQLHVYKTERHKIYTDRGKCTSWNFTYFQKAQNRTNIKCKYTQRLNCTELNEDYWCHQTYSCWICDFCDHQHRGIHHWNDRWCVVWISRRQGGGEEEKWNGTSCQAVLSVSVKIAVYVNKQRCSHLRLALAWQIPDCWPWHSRSWLSTSN